MFIFFTSRTLYQNQCQCQVILTVLNDKCWKSRIYAREVKQIIAYDEFWSSILNCIFAKSQIKSPDITRADCAVKMRKTLSHIKAAHEMLV